MAPEIDNIIADGDGVIITGEHVGGVAQLDDGVPLPPTQAGFFARYVDDGAGGGRATFTTVIDIAGLIGADYDADGIVVDGDAVLVPLTSSGQNTIPGVGAVDFGVGDAGVLSIDMSTGLGRFVVPLATPEFIRLVAPAPAGGFVAVAETADGANAGTLDDAGAFRARALAHGVDAAAGLAAVGSDLVVTLGAVGPFGEHAVPTPGVYLWRVGASSALLGACASAADCVGAFGDVDGVCDVDGTCVGRCACEDGEGCDVNIEGIQNAPTFLCGRGCVDDTGCDVGERCNIDGGCVADCRTNPQVCATDACCVVDGVDAGLCGAVTGFSSKFVRTVRFDGVDVDVGGVDGVDDIIAVGNVDGVVAGLSLGGGSGLSVTRFDGAAWSAPSLVSGEVPTLFGNARAAPVEIGGAAGFFVYVEEDGAPAYFVVNAVDDTAVRVVAEGRPDARGPSLSGRLGAGHVFGGAAFGAPLGEVHRYDVDLEQWSLVTVSLTGRLEAAFAVVSDDEFVFLGGTDIGGFPFGNGERLRAGVATSLSTGAVIANAVVVGDDVWTVEADRLSASFAVYDADAVAPRGCASTPSLARRARASCSTRRRRAGPRWAASTRASSTTPPAAWPSTEPGVVNTNRSTRSVVLRRQQRTSAPQAPQNWGVWGADVGNPAAAALHTIHVDNVESTEPSSPASAPQTPQFWGALGG